MKKLVRRTLRVSVALVALSFLLDSCMQFRLSDKRIQKKFKQLPQNVKLGHYTVGDRKMRYVEVGEEDKPMILFVHGAPGSSKDFLEYLQDTSLASQARMIAVDRPGYGYSGFGKTVISIEEQAACIAPLLDLNKNEKPVLLVGHSFGGPVVARLAMDYPDKANGNMLLLAPAIDPDNEKIFWFNHPFNWWGLNWILPRSLKVANKEKLSHAAELEKMKPLWDRLQNNTTFVHGYADWIVTIANSQYGIRMMKNAQVDSVIHQDMDHLMIWNRYDMVKGLILKLL